MPVWILVLRHLLSILHQLLYPPSFLNCQMSQNPGHTYVLWKMLQLLQKWQDWDTWLICFSHQHSEQDLIHSMCPAHGPSSEELGSHFHILFLLLNQLCSFPTYLMTRHSSWNVWYSPSKDSQPSQQYSSGWQATVKPPSNSSLSLEFWGIGEIQTPDH